jgi:tetratricopeptide (TPR) repeat protein
MGADELYDVIKFKVDAPKKTPVFPLAAEPQAVGAKVYMIPYATAKKGVFREGVISEVSKVKNAFCYYKTTLPLESDQFRNAPVVTETGEALGLMQEDVATKKKEVSYAVSAGYANSLAVTSTGMLSTVYTRIGIRKAWPENAEQAGVSLYLLGSSQDAKTYLETLNDFIATFPDSPEGYLNRASHYAYHRKDLAATASTDERTCLSRSLEDYNTALRHSPSKGNVWFEKARVIYNVVISDTTLSGDRNWNLTAAMNTLQEAVKAEDKPLYHQLEGDIYLMQNMYEKAYESYGIVNRSEMATSSSFYWAARALENISGANIGDMIALMDSAIAKLGPDVTDEKLSYVLQRIDYKAQLSLHDETVKDYDLYYDMLKGNVGEIFFYYRGQAKFRSGNTAGALEDIQEALRRNPQEPDYLAEEASVHIRMEDYVKALASLDKALANAPDFSSCHRLKGVCLVRLGKGAEACEAFNKAQELGDPLASRLIREHCK